MRLPRSAGRLTSAELAEAAVLGDLSVALLFLGWMLPFGPVIQLLSVVPPAALAYRRRPRAVVAAAVASSSVAFLLGGVNLWSIALVVSFMGLAIGAATRRGWGRVRLLLSGALIWAAVAGVSVGQLLVFSGFRKLAFDQIRNSWHGLRRVLGVALAWVPGVRTWLHDGDRAINWVITHWYVMIPAGELLLVEGMCLAAAALARPAVRSLERAMGAPIPGPVPVPSRLGSTLTPCVPGPVPAVLEEVAYRYPGADRYALSGVNLEVPTQGYMAVVGANGSGKSTLARLVAGLLSAEGSIVRPGGTGLGQLGGTAMVFQRPESQVLGVRVRDDIVWGMDPTAAAAVDLAAVLGRVGLDNMEEEETSTLSGGQLQRLAIASALARSPRLLVSDESTSMLDPTGRRQVADLLVSLAAEGLVTVLHVTHRPDEAASADLTVHVDAGQVAVP